MSITLITDEKRKPDVVFYSEIYADFQKSAINDVRLGYNGKSVSDSIFYILNTRKGERLMLPEFGSDLYQFLFEPIDEQVTIDIEMEIRDALERWEPRAIIDDVIVIADHDRNTYHCTLRFHIRNLEGDLQEIKLTFMRQFY